MISNDGEQLGIVQIAKALELAEEAGLDLVEVSPNAKPPVVKIIDWGKYQYEIQKQQQKQKAKQKTIEVKGIRLGIKISEHDLTTKLRATEKFLAKQNKVRFQLRFRGREVAHKEIGERILNSIADRLSEVADVEQQPIFAGREMTLIVAPKKKANSIKQ